MLEEASEEEEQQDQTPEDRVEAQAVDIADAAGGTPEGAPETALSAEERAERLRAEREERTRDEASNEYSFRK